MSDDTSRSVLAWPIPTQQPPATNGEPRTSHQSYALEEGIPLPVASTALVQRVVGKPFAPGQSGNPNGRPKGSRNKISELFAMAMRDDFAAYGHDAIARLRERDPASYLNLVRDMIPPDALAKAEEQSDKVDFGKMTDVEFVEFMEETEGSGNPSAIAKMRRDQAVSLVLSGKAANVRTAMIMLGADLD